MSRRLKLTSASAVEPEPVRWLWDGRIPLGMLTLIVGMPGLGKSTLGTYLASRLSNGTLKGDLYGESVPSLIASAEDPWASVLRPRLEAHRANLDRVHFISVREDGTEDALTLPNDLLGIAKAVKSSGARMLFVDPITAFLSAKVDGHKEQQVRRVFGLLQRIAERRGVAVVAVMHVNKSRGAQSLMRISGSMAFPAAARSVLIVGRDPDDEDGNLRVLAHSKCNVGPEQKSRGFQLREVVLPTTHGNVTTSRLQLLGESGVSAEELLDVAPSRDGGKKLTAAEQWLTQALEGKPQARADLLMQAVVAGHSQRTLQRAASRLRVKTKNVGGFGADKRVTWSLNGNGPHR